MTEALLYGILLCMVLVIMLVLYEEMYKNVLLTVSEINLIRKVLHDHLDKNMMYINDKEQRIFI